METKFLSSLRENHGKNHQRSSVNSQGHAECLSWIESLAYGEEISEDSDSLQPKEAGKPQHHEDEGNIEPSRQSEMEDNSLYRYSSTVRKIGDHTEYVVCSMSIP